jgi:UDPglucose 6-dehydrogenase
MKKYKITIIGAGYVGMSLAVLLATKHEVQVLDINKDRVDLINDGKSTIYDETIEKYLNDCSLSLSATDDNQHAFKDANFFIIATPTNYDPITNQFDTESVENVISSILKHTKKGLIVIKSTIPVGFTKKLNKLHNTDRIIFSPEFLREGRALEDNLYPSRIIIGSQSNEAKKFSTLLSNCAIKEEIPILFMGSDEAEAVKLFANTFLAMRVAYFNELDSYGLRNNLNVQDIIEGASLDPRIGNFYNNPSFGYGGYCLPKDTKQLLSNFKNVPQNLIKAIVDSNQTRKKFIVDEILLNTPKVVGIYGLAMKQGSDNHRFSAIQDIIQDLILNGIEIIIYEKTLKQESFMNCKVQPNLEKFKHNSDLIIANRILNELSDVGQKVFTRDIFHLD